MRLMKQSTDLVQTITMIGAGGHAYSLYSCLSREQKKNLNRIGFRRAQNLLNPYIIRLTDENLI